MTIDRAKWDRLTLEQKQAVRDFAVQVQKKAPEMYATMQIARRLFDELVNSPTLHIADTEAGPAQPLMQWDMGPPKMNFFDAQDNPISYNEWKGKS